MKESIENIFRNNIKLLYETDKAVFYFRQQQYDIALGILADSIDRIKYTVEAIISSHDYFNLVDSDSVIGMLTGILKAKKSMDYILLGDLLELQLLSFLYSVQELIISKEEISFDEEEYQRNRKLLFQKSENLPDQISEPINPAGLVEKGYRVEFTSCGLMTLAAENEGKDFYFHSNSGVQREAFLLAKHWFKEEINRYILYGFGMGYHIRELLMLSQEAQIEVYESDSNVLQLACAFSDIGDILSEKRVKLIYDADLTLLKERKERLTDSEKLIVHYPSYQNLRNNKNRKIIEDEFPWSKTIESC